MSKLNAVAAFPITAAGHVPLFDALYILLAGHLDLQTLWQLHTTSDTRPRDDAH
ncbi:hypothetical protein B0H14DRAFT_3451141 [Mycena olivaceomarginata]|nr:hypothetical protein B0H14DRAFT_3490991 [Mycena olivaceomarginata]KAJ7851831.1 hypothetical protein B0H14DRAFT_3451141 [Mycena olivaceomarginata]